MISTAPWLAMLVISTAPWLAMLVISTAPWLAMSNEPWPSMPRLAEPCTRAMRPPKPVRFFLECVVAGDAEQRTSEARARAGAPLRGGARRIVYLVIGFFFVGLGGLGAVLPVLPTTPFLLISLWAFSQSSVRFENWLLEHPRFGPRLVAWRLHRVIPLPAKLAAWGSMIASLTIMLVVDRPLWQIGLAAGVMAIGATYVASKPSRPPPEA